MKAQYEISQKAAILAGNDFFGTVTVNIDPSTLTPEQREELAACPTRDGIISLGGLVDGAYNPGEPPFPNFGAPDELAPVAYLQARMAIRKARKEHALQRAAEKAKRIDKMIATILEDPQTLIETPYSSNEIEYVGESSARWTECHLKKHFAGDCLIDDPRLAEILPAITAEIERRNAESEKAAVERAKRLESERLAKIAEQESRATRKTAQVVAWVEANGTESQKKRLLVGLLPEPEIVDLIRAEAFAPLDSEERYQKLRNVDFCECDYPDDVNYDVEDATMATSEQFERMEHLKALLPEATITLRLHTGQCESCEKETSRMSARVQMKVGEFEFSREYAVD